MWPTTTTVTTLLVKSIQVTLNPKISRKFEHMALHTKHNRHPLKPLFLQCEMTWTNYWQSRGQIADNKIRKRGSKYWLLSIYIYGIYIYVYMSLFYMLIEVNKCGQTVGNLETSSKCQWLQPASGLEGHGWVSSAWSHEDHRGNLASGLASFRAQEERC